MSVDQMLEGPDQSVLTHLPGQVRRVTLQRNLISELSGIEPSQLLDLGVYGQDDGSQEEVGNVVRSSSHRMLRPLRTYRTRICGQVDQH